MKILKESKKEELPISFLTNFVSQGWSEIGNLKEELQGIKETFTGTRKVESIIQDLIDAYLICVGQLELHLDKKDYLDFSVQEESKPITENLDKAVLTDLIDSEKELVTKSIAAENTLTPEDAEEIQVLNSIETNALGEVEVLKNIDKAIKSSETNVDPLVNNDTLINGETTDKCDFFIDFDEPDLTAEKLTDEDIYGKTE